MILGCKDTSRLHKKKTIALKAYKNFFTFLKFVLPEFYLTLNEF